MARKTRKRFKEDILEYGHTTEELEPYCPHCANEIWIEYIFEAGCEPNGEQNNVLCPVCDKEFSVIVDTVFSTSRNLK